jgi:CheY-like chemotaxis protein
LLVEDNPDDDFLVRRAFRKAFGEVQVVSVRDGEAALAYLQRQSPYDDVATCPWPTLLLLDLKLPRLSGFEVLSWVRGREKLRRLPVVVLTSSRERGDVDRAYDLGANSYLVKPVSTEGAQSLAGTLGRYWLTLNEPPAFR